MRSFIYTVKRLFLVATVNSGNNVSTSITAEQRATQFFTLLFSLANNVGPCIFTAFSAEKFLTDRSSTRRACKPNHHNKNENVAHDITPIDKKILLPRRAQLR